jgi:hypothetical protein
MVTELREVGALATRYRDKSGLRARLSGHVLESRSIEAGLRLAMREREELEAQTGLTRR